MNINNRKRKVKEDDYDYILENEFRKKLILTDKETKDDLFSRKRKKSEENSLENEIRIKKAKIDKTYSLIIRKRKDNENNQDNEEYHLKIRKIYQCSVHEHNKSICEVYNCIGIHNNFEYSNIDMYII